MLKIIGIIVVLGSVAGGYVLSHGKLGAIWQPYELIIICGAAFGAFLIANGMPVIKGVGSGLGAVFSGKLHWHKDSYMELLSLLYEVFNKARKSGLISIEEDIENPAGSEIFMRYHHVNSNAKLVDFICDYLRIIASGNLSANELESLMDQEIETAMHEATEPAHAVNRVADGLPGFGIVAAVLGIVITMGSLGGPPDELGHHVGAALVGTFLGILFAYGFLAPLSNAMEHDAKESMKIYECAKVCMLAMVNGIPPQLAVEFGRKVLPGGERPTFSELDSALRGR
ncbi:Flagellar motor component [gamma proteobacterium HdN1]|nr:Flagellar motor component [gamma proteobacterium HdN1]